MEKPNKSQLQATLTSSVITPLTYKIDLLPRQIIYHPQYPFHLPNTQESLIVLIKLLKRHYFSIDRPIN